MSMDTTQEVSIEESLTEVGLEYLKRTGDFPTSYLLDDEDSH